jgi:sterol desaturase/sphingolipid hydroxylase (fatty acid hydroxylase superfamily)
VTAAASTSLTSIGLFLTGWLGWTLGEYLLHRFDMHGARARGAMHREHLEHHAGRPLVPDRSVRGWTGGALLAVVLAWGAHPAVGVGWMAGYALYDLQHWAIHARPPSGRYQRWLRRHHLHHHFAAPARNYGVTVPIWDLTFGTYARPTVVPVPRPLAMPWLVGPDGQMVQSFAADYELVDASPPGT